MMAHGLTAEKEKTIFVALLGIVALSVLVWFSADFPSQGQAYNFGLELEQAQNLNRDLLTYCDSPSTCLLVDELAQLDGLSWELEGKQVSVYELTFYGSDGVQVGIDSSFDTLNLHDLEVSTVGFQGMRYPLFSLTAR